MEEFKEPEPTWEPEPFDALDERFDGCEANEMLQVTTTYPNGLIVKHMNDGNVVQMHEEQVFGTEPKEEKDRVFLFNSSGVVIRHFRNRDAEVLYPSGQHAFFSKATMTWTVTTNKGLRTATKSGVSWDLEPIPCAYETDPVTQAKMMIREDKVMTIRFKEGSFYC